MRNKDLQKHEDNEYKRMLQRYRIKHIFLLKIQNKEYLEIPEYTE